MDGRGGCCIAKYAAATGGGGAYDMSKVDRIMLQFRPIAPKPAFGGSSSGGSSPERKGSPVRSGRGRRRHVRSDKRSCYGSNKQSNRKRKPASGEDKMIVRDAKSPQEKVTLPLLPEISQQQQKKKKNDRLISGADYFSFSTDAGAGPEQLCSFAGASIPKQAQVAPKWLTLDDDSSDPASKSTISKEPVGIFRSAVASPLTLQPPATARKVAPSSWVTVECVTDTWDVVEGGNIALGHTDAERRMSLEKDTCPGLISDGLGRVTWTNGAFRKMVAGSEDVSTIVVRLVVKDSSVARAAVGRSTRWWSGVEAYTCRVRMEYCTCGGKEKRTVTSPCDVWRMEGEGEVEGGGLAWRLDVEAALRLGR